MAHYKRGSFSGRRGVSSGARRSAANSTPNQQICIHFEKGNFGSSCKFSHNLDRDPTPRNRHIAKTSEQLEAKASYVSWRSTIRKPPPGTGLLASRFLWEGALDILNGADRDCKQALPRDLEDEEQYFGRQYIRALLCERAKVGHYQSFIEASRSFFLVMTHPILVDCLSVDTYVGNLYSFMSGTNGARAIPFFQHVCEIIERILLDPHRSTQVDTLNSTLVGLLETLSELLHREQRARFNEGLPKLLDSLDTSAELTMGESVVTSNLIISRVRDLRSVVARAHALLSTGDDDEQQARPTRILPASYPRDAIKPGGRHDNDKADITDMNIFPTQDEIMCDAKEFLPSSDPDQPYFLDNKLERYIDTYFRLLRHDVLGQLKDDIGSFMRAVIQDPKQVSNPRPGFSEHRTYSYSNAFVSYLLLKKNGGLQARLSFQQPRSFRKGQNGGKRNWWEESRRLEEGVLLSFVWNKDSRVQHLFLIVAERSTDPKSDGSLTRSDSIATITTKLATQDQQHVGMLLKLSCEKTHGVMLEFPHVLPATFTPILESLQDMQRLNRMPFHDWILPSRVEEPAVPRRVPPPLYARHGGFAFPLDAILGCTSNAMSLPSTSSDQDCALMADLQTKTGLDSGQCSALIAALTREFALIQGPPGTGKSYVGVKIMQVLQSVKDKANLGPILVVCYTNHALDQFLEHLIATGIRKIVRIGGQSRSELLESHNLRHITKSERKSRHEGWQVASAYRALEEHEERFARVLGRAHGVRKRPEWRAFQHHLARKYPRVCEQFNTWDVDGFKTAGRHPFDIWTSGIKEEDVVLTITASSTRAVDRTTIIEKANRNVQELSSPERQALVAIWTQEIQEDAAAELFEVVEDSERSHRDLSNVHEEIKRRVLQASDVIGVTTSGLAKNSSTIRRVRSKVVICEEAGEVLEPHVMSALLPSVQHFIQIGDHQQLRPSINNFLDLSLESDRGKLHQLDRSQFERLSVGQPGRPPMPFAQLNVQRRMRPEISTLIRETIYKRLEDHPSTMQLPDVVGMRKNVFWLNHNNVEDDGGRGTEHHKKSKSNEWEIQMVHALVRHVVRQGVYSTSDIAVLTPYTGQLQGLRAAMRNDFEIVLSDRDEEALIKDGFSVENPTTNDAATKQQLNKKPLEKRKLSELLRIATVDNFQGEEAKIIIVSLVRSNKARKVGFLRTTNRINVLLSRAQHGMYLIGNTDTYSYIPMWQKVIDMLRAQDSMGPSLELCCPRHVDTVIAVQQPGDFQKFSPEGGCREACKDRLPDCGHRCQARCHSRAMHDVFQCEQPCQRRHQPCNHSCQKSTCGESCGKCIIPVNDLRLGCGHTKDGVLCYRTQDVSSITCDVIVTKTVPGCGHEVVVRCHQDVHGDTYRCSTPCDAILRCGHTCPGNCGSCNRKTLEGNKTVEHQKCAKVCGRNFGTCNHTCPRDCHDGSDCGLCTSECEVACKHSRCNLKCHEACAPCIEPCTWSCSHQGACTMPCSAPCNRLPCNERCTRLLPCGHQCPGLCGEDCLSAYCQACEMKLDSQVDMIEFREYAEINLQETPVVALSCGHFFTTETLDGLIGLNDVYEIDPSGKCISLGDCSTALSLAIPKCPQCQRPVQQYTTHRYNRLINRAVIDEMSKRFVVTGQTALQEIERRLVEIDTALKASRQDVVRVNPASTLIGARQRGIEGVTQKLGTRYMPALQLRADIVKLQGRTAKHQQPAQKLYDATMHALQDNGSLEDAWEGLKLEHVPNISERDDRIALRTSLMRVRADGMILEDKLRLVPVVKDECGDSASSFALFEHSTAQAFFRSCEKLIADCKEKALMKIAVELSLLYAQLIQAIDTAGLCESDDREMATTGRERARNLLEQAMTLCEHGFHDAETLLEAVNQYLKLLQKEWYEKVTDQELEAIKKAMVSGSKGIATHSGHWYNCANGHPFAIGECGMPMELARCPECGAKIGGQHHQAVQGVTRAERMEN